MIKDILDKKRLGNSLTKKELEFIFMGYLKGIVESCQMSSLLMAICIHGLSRREVFDLTDIFIKSGEVLDFSDLSGIKVDKHSTGGIGDKTTLVVAPVVASLGIPVIKMSGRGLGYTGGTIDKLESIKGFRTDLSNQEIHDAVSKIGIVITGQTADLVPLDRAIYALRDITGTTSSIPLIAISIMSKKIAGGADKILLDVKYGKGALISTIDDAKSLGHLMVEIGEKYGREVRYVMTDMNTPLGSCVGNSIELVEAVDVLRGVSKGALYDLCVELASHMVSMAKKISVSSAEKLVIEVLHNDEAYKKFVQLVKNQGGDINSATVSLDKFEVFSKKSGVIKGIDALEIGKLSLCLGAGRLTQDDIIDHSVGIFIEKNVGERVDIGDLLMTLYINRKNKFKVKDTIFDIQ